MRCRKHFFDFSSDVGVCATCLRERLNVLIQTQSNDQPVLLVRPQLDDDEHRKSDAIQPQIVFPRSVSPYVSRRKSDTTAAQLHRFYSTPQIGPNGVIDTERRSRGKFSILSKLFRSKTQKLDAHRNIGDRRTYSTSDASGIEIPEAVSETTPSWFSSLFASKSKKKMMSKSFPAFGNRKNHRGMSPAVESDEEWGDKVSDYSTQASPWKETPVRATPRRQNQRYVAGMAFCLSPLVRPSPNRSWTLKGVTPESVVPSGDGRAPVKPHLAEAASFRGNRSRKLANFGRLNPKY
ncbi:hypothetical protein DCAR_0728726 [Daucus carota subsp. sativus]|uniref:Uncharacterized protein n=1 Tax=Daucus carota subsp. sativus TaxID=79200 RepID=A0A161ZNL9_DAUCS|nr:PREDICTED: uncharacterized protein LOC108194818 [Daucus carota subsp. sativus]WOH09270.1 hypothetical protein DCAR_0728726 [Daucus carota subsp. sativus]